MKISLQDIDQTQFMVHPHIIGGKTVYLVQPQHIGAKFTQANKHLRSSVWDHEGNPVSLAFPKFTNFGEKPEQFPVPTSLKNTTVVEKLDGSLICCSLWKGNVILRTRGTVDATKLDNGFELEIFKDTILSKLLNHFKNQGDSWNQSILFEWLSPENKIVIDYGLEPQFKLIGAIYHSSYNLWTQSQLDLMANHLKLERPETYNFPSIEELISGVQEWVGKEGTCLYSNNDQDIHKIKSFDYLKKHRFKSEATLENTLELYFQFGKPTYQEFSTKLQTTFDYECFEMVRNFVSLICDANKQVQQIVSGFETFVNNTLKPLPSRKLQADRVLNSYSTTNRASMVFTLLDGKSLSDEQLKKLFWQVLKK